MEALGRFEALPDLMGSADYPGTISRSYGAGADYTDEMKDKGSGGDASRLTNTPSVSVTAKDEWGAEWVAPLPDCEAGAEYVFRAEFFPEKDGKTGCIRR